MTPTAHDLWKVLDAIDHHHRAALAKSVKLRAMISSMNLKEPDEHVCPVCGIARPTAEMVTEHVELLHT